MELSFDPAKDAANKRKHGVSLSRALDFDIDSAQVTVDDREDYGELRWKALGFLEAELYMFTFTLRGAVVRAISLRKATRHEEREYAD